LKKTFTPERRAKISEATRKRNTDPQYKKEQIKKRQETWKKKEPELFATRVNAIREKILKLGLQKTEYIYEEVRIKYFKRYNKFSLVTKKYPDLLMDFKRNHRVKQVQIKTMPIPMKMYDITVDSKYHNFPLGAGVFVHNSGSVELKSSPLTIKSSIAGTVEIISIESEIENKDEDIENEIELFNKIIITNNYTKREYITSAKYSRLFVKNNDTIKEGGLLAIYDQNIGTEDIAGTLQKLIMYYEAKNKIPIPAIVAKEEGMFN